MYRGENLYSFFFSNKTKFHAEAFLHPVVLESMKGQNNYLYISLFLSKKLIIKMMSTHVYFYTIFFLKP